MVDQSKCVLTQLEDLNPEYHPWIMENWNKFKEAEDQRRMMIHKNDILGHRPVDSNSKGPLFPLDLEFKYLFKAEVILFEQENLVEESKAPTKMEDSRVAEQKGPTLKTISSGNINKNNIVGHQRTDLSSKRQLPPLNPTFKSFELDETQETFIEETKSPQDNHIDEQKRSPIFRTSSISLDEEGLPLTLFSPHPLNVGHQSPRRDSVDSNYSNMTEEDMNNCCKDSDYGSDYEKEKKKKKTKNIKRPRKPLSSKKDLTPPLPKQKITRWLHALLESKAHNPMVLKWEDKEKGLFKVMNQEELGRLWGQAKRNDTMTYDKFSRACRYYYDRKELEIVRKKMFYKFGPKSDFFKRRNIEM